MDDTTFRAGPVSICSEFHEALQNLRGNAVAQLVEALRYKPEGRGFDSPVVSLEFFYWHNPSGRTVARV